MSVTEKSRCLIKKSNQGSCYLSLMFEVVRRGGVVLFNENPTVGVTSARILNTGTTSAFPLTLVMIVCLFVCLFVWIKPEIIYFAPCVWREVITPGNGCTRTQAQITCVRQRQRHRPRGRRIFSAHTNDEKWEFRKCCVYFTTQNKLLST